MAHQDPTPIPPRFRSLKRILITMALTLVSVVCVRLYAGHEAERRYRAAIDALRAAGEPLEPRDFALPEVPDAENAAVYLKQAASAFVQPPEGSPSLRDVSADLDLRRSLPGVVLGMLKANADVLRLLRTARAKTRANWGTEYLERSSESEWWPNFMPHSDLAALLSVAAIFHHSRGEERAAVEALRDLLGLSEHLNAQRGFLLSHRMAVTTSSTCVATLETILPDLAIADPGADSRATAATRDQLDLLIHDLLDDESLRGGVAWGFQGDRSFMLQILRPALDTPGLPVREAIAGSDSLAGRVSDLLRRPLYLVDAVHILEYYAALVEAARAADWPSAQRHLPAAPGSFGSALDRYTRLLSMIVLPNFQGTLRNATSKIATRRLAGAGIAVRLYTLDHGARPSALEELVPKYLPAVPTDPFSADGQQIIYVNDGPTVRLELRDGTVFKLQGGENGSDATATEESTERVNERNNIENNRGQTDDDESADNKP